MTSKIQEAAKQIKKKISFDDVSTIPSKENSDHINTINDQFTGKEVEKHNSNILNHNTSKEVLCYTNSPANGINNESNTFSEVKKKATYYLSERCLKQMEEMFVQSILNGNKQDKSALICEAIELLYAKKCSKK